MFLKKFLFSLCCSVRAVLQSVCLIAFRIQAGICPFGIFPISVSTTTFVGFLDTSFWFPFVFFPTPISLRITPLLCFDALTCGFSKGKIDGKRCDFVIEKFDVGQLVFVPPATSHFDAFLEYRIFELPD